MHDDGPLVGRARGPAAAAVAAADHDDEEKNRAANRDTLEGVAHLIPPCEEA